MAMERKTRETLAVEQGNRKSSLARGQERGWQWSKGKGLRCSHGTRGTWQAYG